MWQFTKSAVEVAFLWLSTHYVLVLPLWKCSPTQITKREADEFTGKYIVPHCCVLASCMGEAATVGPLRHVLKFRGTMTPKSYLLFRGEQNAQVPYHNNRLNLTHPSMTRCTV